MKKIILLLALAQTFVVYSQRTFTPGVMLSYFRTFEQPKCAIFGVAGSLEVIPDASDVGLTQRVSFGLYTEGNKRGFITAGPRLGYSLPEVAVNYTKSVLILSGAYDLKWYPGGDRAYEDGGFYLARGVHAVYLKGQLSYENFQGSAAYYIPYTNDITQPVKHHDIQAMLMVAPGFEKPVGQLLIFGELSAQASITDPPDIPLPFRNRYSVGINFGVRLMMD